MAKTFISARWLLVGLLWLGLWLALGATYGQSQASIDYIEDNRHLVEGASLLADTRAGGVGPEGKGLRQIG